MRTWGYEEAVRSGFDADGLYRLIYVPGCIRFMRRSHWRDFIRGWDARRHELERERRVQEQERRRNER